MSGEQEMILQDIVAYCMTIFRYSSRQYDEIRQKPQAG